jgi:hypothetical protein
VLRGRKEKSSANRPFRPILYIEKFFHAARKENFQRC